MMVAQLGGRVGKKWPQSVHMNACLTSVGLGARVSMCICVSTHKEVCEPGRVYLTPLRMKPEVSDLAAGGMVAQVASSMS